MESITRQEALARIAALRLPAVVLAAFEERTVPEVLQAEMRAPREIFDAPTAHDVYPPGRIIPLFSNATGGIVVGYRELGEPIGFVRFLLEGEPGHTLDADGLSWDEIAFDLLVAVWEAYDDDDSAAEAVREAAAHLAFEPMERLVAALGEPANRSADAYEAWAAAFRATLQTGR